MAYDLVLETGLRAPPSRDIRNIRNSIEQSLKNVSINIDARQLQKAVKSVQDTTKAQQKGIDIGERFGDVIALKGKNFAAYTIASAAVLKLTNVISKATNEALKFEVEIAKISQTIGRSNKEVSTYSGRILEISKQFGISQTKVAELVRVLAQSGLAFNTALAAAEKLARTSLLATFDNLSSTTEALIALMASFELSVEDAASALDSINSVSKRFAIESSDIIETIKRTGGAFKAAGGDINELTALITSVRSTSRESAETIATAFRTIFGRLQRPRTIEFFKQLNIELLNSEGNFVGAFEAVKRISEGLERAGIAAGSIEFAQVVEQIGGIRQLSKVVPLIQQFGKAQKALAIANSGVAETDADVIKAKLTLSQQIKELQANFNALITEVTQSETFNFLAQTFIKIADAVIETSRAFKEFIPLLTVVAGFKLSAGIASVIKGGLRGPTVGGSGSGSFGKFARGGLVPGSGNGDTVPAMLTPGEFVIRKSAVQAFGTGNLASINKYANGTTGTGVKDDIAIKRQKTLAARKASVGSSFDPYSKSSRIQRIDLAKKTDRTKVSGAQLAEEAINKSLSPAAIGGIRGIMFELATGATESGFPDLPKAKAQKLLGTTVDGAELKYTDNANTRSRYISSFFGPDGVKYRKKYGDIIPMVYGYNSGGTVGTDTVPALLTPGEFVVNKKSAQSFGYGKLRNINKYAKGGVVQKFQDGGEVAGGGGSFFESLTSSGLQIVIFTQIIKQLSEGMQQLRKGVKGISDAYDRSIEKRKKLDDRIEKNTEALEKAKVTRDNLNKELERSKAEDVRQETIIAKAAERTEGGSLSVRDKDFPSSELREQYLAVIKQYAKDEKVTQKINGIKEKYGQGTRASANAIIALGKTLKQAERANIQSVESLKEQIKSNDQLVKAQEKRRRDLERVKEGRSFTGKIKRGVQKFGPEAISGGVIAGVAAFSNNLNKASEAAAKNADAAIKAGNVNEAYTQTLESVAKKQEANAIQQGALAGAALGSFAGPLGTAFGSAIGAVLGFSGFLTDITDALGLTNSALEQQLAAEKAASEAQVQSLSKLSDQYNKTIAQLQKTGAGPEKLVEASAKNLSDIIKKIEASGGRLNLVGKEEEDVKVQEDADKAINDLFDSMSTAAKAGVDLTDAGKKQLDFYITNAFVTQQEIDARKGAIALLLQESQARIAAINAENKKVQELLAVRIAFSDALAASADSTIRVNKALQASESALNLFKGSIASVPITIEKLDAELSSSQGFKDTLQTLSTLGIEGKKLANDIAAAGKANKEFENRLSRSSQTEAASGEIGFDENQLENILKPIADNLGVKAPELVSKALGGKKVLGAKDLLSFVDQQNEINKQALDEANKRLEVLSKDLENTRKLAQKKNEIELSIIQAQFKVRQEILSISDSLSLTKKSFAQIAREQSASGRGIAAQAGFDIGGGTLGDQAKRVADKLVELQAEIEDLNLKNKDDIAKKEELIKKQQLLKQSFDQLTDTSQLLQAAQNEQAKILKKKSLAEELTFGGAARRQQFGQNVQASSFLAAGGSAQALPEELRGQVFQFLKQFSDVNVAGGLTGQEIIDQETRRALLMSGVAPDKVEELINASVPIEQKMLEQQVAQTGYLARIAGEFGLREQAAQAAGFAKGGGVFKSRGTDTVPAMLTPGEFVIRKSAVDKIGADNLAAMNNGGKVVYAASGQLVDRRTQLEQRKERNRAKAEGRKPVNTANIGINQSEKLKKEKEAKRLKEQAAEKAAEEKKISERQINPVKTFNSKTEADSFVRRLSAYAALGEKAAKAFNVNIRAGALQAAKANTPATSKPVVSTPKKDDGELNELFANFDGKSAPIIDSKQAELLDPLYAKRKAEQSKREAEQSRLQEMFGNSQRKKTQYRIAQARQQAIISRRQGRGKNIKNAQFIRSFGRVANLSLQAINKDINTGISSIGRVPLGKSQIGQLQSIKTRLSNFIENGASDKNPMLTFNKIRADYFSIVRSAQPKGFAVGGNVDSVPAMLTPGEFVMSPESVNKYGTGFMNQLNKGKMPGFRKGGPVYRQGGGSAGNGGGSFVLGEGFNESVNKISEAFTIFSNAVAAFEAIPKDFTMSIAPVNVTLSIVGAEVFNSLEPQLNEMVQSMISNAIPQITEQVTRNQRGGFV